MIKNIIAISIVIILLLIGTLYAIEYFALSRKSIPDGETVILNATPTDTEDLENEAEIESVPYEITVFAENLFVPWSMEFTDETRMLVTERNGNVRVIENGELRPDPIYVFDEVSNRSEEGLMGMTLHPNYSENKYVYFSLAYMNQSDMVVKVVGLIDQGETLVFDEVIIDNIPAARFHAGSQIAFGPDGKLYITTGDSTNKDLAQDMNSLAGKILRINDDGSIPDDNPFEDSAVYSLGHRNPQGLDWYPGTDILYSSEHGPSLFDGPAGGDEINVIVPGGNYGWPIVSHEKSADGMINPAAVFTPAIAPASGMFYDSDVLPQFTNSFFVGMLQGEGLMRFVISKANPSIIQQYERFPNINVGRIRSITQGPDGSIYFATSNRDGRGDANEADDRIFRISPIEAQ